MKRAMKKYTLFSYATAALLTVCACTPTINVRGNLLKDYQLAEVVPGVDTQSDILRKLGSPTTKAPFDDNVWYYIGQETEKRGILDPEVKEEKIIVVFFDETGVVKNMETVDNQRVDLPYVREKTQTSGTEMNAMQQLLGNVGKFNKTETPTR
jgi:outer membrane protein assembly factor BamE (lipoprotein component of BamABCDE complex)